ncbi:hypothetical protein F5B20DRAFT_2909 [Whalleya microplaca]|nr:hypothetical protein F5B20DRAFT_2909 [Whalleya microplaca]
MAEIPDSDFSPDPPSSSPLPRSVATVSGTSTASGSTDLASLLFNIPISYREQGFGRPRSSLSPDIHQHHIHHIADDNFDHGYDSDPRGEDHFASEDEALFGNFNFPDHEHDEHGDPFSHRPELEFDDLEEEGGLFVDDDDNDDNNGNVGDIDLDGPGGGGGPRGETPDLRGRSSPSPGFWRIHIRSPPFHDLQQYQMDRDVHRRNVLRDELVAMEMEGQANRRSRRNRQQMPQAPAQGQGQGQPHVIDLTGDDGEPESPPRRTPFSASQPNLSQNARRRRSQQRNTPPRLSRSDANYMGNRTVIDLVSDSDDEVRPRPRRNASNNASNNGGQGARNSRPADQRPRAFLPPLPPPNGRDLGPGRNALHQIQHLFHNIPIFRLLNPQGAAQDEDIVMVGQRNLIPAPGVPPPPGLAPVHLDYIAHPFGNAQQHMPGMATPKPPHEPPKEARDGFTRNTGDDVVAVCASCDEELAYDPDADDANPTTPPKKARTKKDKAEHHFWAVKACGHVYCRRCYENRRPAARNPVPVGFRPDPKGAKNKMFCAVEECESDVSSKAAWVGIFM